jgi:hypothetical protein
MSGRAYDGGSLDDYKECSFCGWPTFEEGVESYRFNSAECEYANVCEGCSRTLGPVIHKLKKNFIFEDGEDVYAMTAEFAEAWKKGKRKQIKDLEDGIGHIDELAMIDASKKKKKKKQSKAASKSKTKGKSKRKADSDEEDEEREESAPAAKKRRRAPGEKTSWSPRQPQEQRPWARARNSVQ